MAPDAADLAAPALTGRFGALIARPGVDEVCELRSRFGLMAFHGGNLERTTDVIAREAAERTGASLYAVIQRAPLREHVPSISIRPEHSERLRQFLDHVHTVIAVHGYGRETQFWNVLLGGRNRTLAAHLAKHLRSALPQSFSVVDDLDAIPEGLRGLHEANPVNLPPNTGVQLELPPTIRWNKQARNWSDHDGTPRAPQVGVLIDALVEAVDAWTEQQPDLSSRPLRARGARSPNSADGLQRLERSPRGGSAADRAGGCGGPARTPP